MTAEPINPAPPVTRIFTRNHTLELLTELPTERCLIHECKSQRSTAASDSVSLNGTAGATLRTSGAFYSLMTVLLMDIDKLCCKFDRYLLFRIQTRRLRTVLDARPRNQPKTGPISIPISSASTMTNDTGNCGPAQPRNSSETDC